tara:strand:- start:137 stop:571 length:435 start_codon:yes stop_codon:yes gene_type:complete
MALWKKQSDENGVLEGYKKTTPEGETTVFIGGAHIKDVLDWIADGGVPDEDDTLLQRVKDAKINEYNKEGLRRIALQVSEWNNMAIISTVKSLWSQISNHTPAQILAKDIFLYVENTAIPNVNAQTTVAAVQAVDIPNDVNWPT